MLLFLVFALAIGACVAWVWSSVFDTHGPWNSFFWFFMVIFLFSWGGGSWIHPFGPTGWGWRGSRSSLWASSWPFC